MPKWLIITGLMFIAVGLALQFAPWLVNWFGRLPGDIHIRGESGQVFIPITSMILVSLILTLLINLFHR
ncbi:MAG: DUF2905 domain-containing protein [Oleiphilaceae bacterium]|nr:DUF2905 domain-containing protein [Oleiphilaceae bacterium]